MGLWLVLGSDDYSLWEDSTKLMFSCPKRLITLLFRVGIFLPKIYGFPI